MVKVQIITSPSGEEMVVLSKADFDALLERLEDLSDVAIYDQRKAELMSADMLSPKASLLSDTHNRKPCHFSARPVIAWQELDIVKEKSPSLGGIWHTVFDTKDTENALPLSKK